MWSVVSCLIALGGFYYWVPPSAPALAAEHRLHSEVECRCVIENGDSSHSEIIGVLKQQLDRCGPEHLQKQACSPCHPCPECPACPVSILPHSMVDINTVLVAAFLAGLFSGCSSVGCCIRPGSPFGQNRAAASAVVNSVRAVHDAPMKTPPPESGPNAAPSIPFGAIPPGQGFGSTPARRRLTSKQSGR